MLIIGIDPGLFITGYGVIDAQKRVRPRLVDAGIIKTSPKKDISQRLLVINQEFNNVIKKFRPNCCVLEELYSHYKHPTTSILMGHARGIICLGCSLNDISLISVSAKRVKKAITGNGNASKDQVARVVCSMLNLVSVPKYNDVTDALGLAIGYAQMMQIPG